MYEPLQKYTKLMDIVYLERGIFYLDSITCYHRPPCLPGRASQTVTPRADGCVSVSAGQRTDHIQTGWCLAACFRPECGNICTAPTWPEKIDRKQSVHIK